MYKPTENELKEILRLHNRYTYALINGVKADLSGTNLSNVNLSNARLCGANLSESDLSHANLNGANLNEAILCVSSLNGCNLIAAKLYGADLSDADLRGADLSWATGNGREILTVYAGPAHVNITDDRVWINGHQHTWEEWTNFNNEEIMEIKFDDNKINISWWRQWKPWLSRIIEERKQQRSQIINKNEDLDGSVTKTMGISGNLN